MSRKILVVDDDPAVRRMLTLLLDSVAPVLSTPTGEEGLKILAAERPSLMLLDMTMPGMGGLEVLKAARAAVPSLTVIMLTGAVDVELAKQSLALGAVEYVTKPFDLPRLKDKVKRSMETASKDDRNSHGLPWRLAEPEIPAAPAPAKAGPTDEALARWEGEGGETKPNEEPLKEVK
jgi:DNA-binding NtrC family response regulator